MSSGQFSQLLLEGLDHYRKGRMMEAVRAWEAAYLLEPTNLRAREFLRSALERIHAHMGPGQPADALGPQAAQPQQQGQYGQPGQPGPQQGQYGQSGAATHTATTGAPAPSFTPAPHPWLPAPAAPAPPLAPKAAPQQAGMSGTSAQAGSAGRGAPHEATRSDPSPGSTAVFAAPPDPMAQTAISAVPARPSAAPAGGNPFAAPSAGNPFAAPYPTAPSTSGNPFAAPSSAGNPFGSPSFMEPPAESPAAPARKAPAAPLPPSSPWDDGPSLAIPQEERPPSFEGDETSGAWKIHSDPLPMEAVADHEVEVWMRGARELVALNDFSGALELLGKILERKPNDKDAQQMHDVCEHNLTLMFESKIGAMEGRPLMAIPPDEVIWLNLDPRAGFVLAQIDGEVTFEDLYAICGLKRLDTARILSELLEQGVVRIEGQDRAVAKRAMHRT